MSTPPSVLLVEDQQLLRLGLRISLETLGCCQVLGEVADGESAVSEAQRLRPQIVLMDVGLPGIDGIEATLRIKQEVPGTRIVMFTANSSEACVAAALSAGADGYCCKDAPVEQIARAINTVMCGQVWLDPAIADIVVRSRDVQNTRTGANLSERQMQILMLIQEGLSNHEIAVRLDTTTERIAQIMHNVIDRFADKRTVGVKPASRRALTTEWLTVFVENLNEERVFADKYLLENLLGSGAMGAVFKARHLFIDRYVALKLLLPEYCEDRFSMRHFQREATVIAKLQHKNIVGLHDFGITKEGEPYLIMEYINGTNLAQILATENRLPVARLVHMCLQVCAGLAEAHSKGIVHCDLKPSNLLILGAAPQETVKIVDFGLAQILAPKATAQSRSKDNMFVSGTPLYMSPEQCVGGQLDERSDIYSLGCIIYEALTGVNVFKGATAAETFSRHMQLIPPPMSKIYAGIFSSQLEQCVAKMLEKDPDARPQSMHQVMLLLSGAGAAWQQHNSQALLGSL